MTATDNSGHKKMMAINGDNDADTTTSSPEVRGHFYNEMCYINLRFTYLLTLLPLPPLKTQTYCHRLTLLCQWQSILQWTLDYLCDLELEISPA